MFMSYTIVSCLIVFHLTYLPTWNGIAVAYHYLSNLPKAGGGNMNDPHEPPPPLAAHSARSSIQTKLSAQNLCAASSKLLDLIRTLRLSALLMEGSSIGMEEEVECLESESVVWDVALAEVSTLEEELRDLRAL